MDLALDFVSCQAMELVFVGVGFDRVQWLLGGMANGDREKACLAPIKSSKRFLYVSAFLNICLVVGWVRTCTATFNF